MLRTTVRLTLSLLMITCALPLMGQNNTTTAVVPRLVNYSGKSSRCRRQATVRDRWRHILHLQR